VTQIGPAPADAAPSGVRRPAGAVRQLAAATRVAARQPVWVAAAMVAVFPLVEAVREAIGPRPVLYAGDQALIDLQARRAWHLDLVVGVYSRFHFHEAGPTLLYLMAPFARAFQPAGPGIYIAAAVINGAMLVALVAVTGRWAGSAAAWWAAAVVGIWELLVRVDTFRQAWNPYLVVAGMALFGLLVAAGAATGRPVAWAWAAVVGSFDLQTHLSTAVPVLVLLASSGAWMLWNRSRRRPKLSPVTATRRGLILPALVFGLEWAAPVVELFRDHPNNLSAMFDFYRSAPAPPPITAAADNWLNALAIVPFGNRVYTNFLRHPHWELAVTVAALGAVWALTWRAARRRPPDLGLCLAGVATVMAGTGLVALARAPGASLAYFATWLAAVPLLSLVALGAVLLDPGRRVSPLGVGAGVAAGAPVPTTGAPVPTAGLVRGALALAAVALSAAVVAADLRLPPLAAANGNPDQAAGAAMAARLLAAGVAPHTQVEIDIVTAGAWPVVAALVDDLDRDRVAAAVGPGTTWAYMFGQERIPGSGVTARFSVWSQADYAARGRSAGRVLASGAGVVLVAG
jgi:hypothetical protein